jgi:hypothetical protein
MSSEYRHLKQALKLPPDRMLMLFESFCERSHALMDSMEWSWKFRGKQAQSNRCFWLGKGGYAEATSRQIRSLAGKLGLLPEDLPGGLKTWHYLLDQHTDRALVGYSGPGLDGRPPACLKIYLTLGWSARRFYSQIVPHRHPDVPAEVPPPRTRLVLVYSAYESGEVSSRTYFFWLNGTLSTVGVARYLRSLIGDRAFSVARMHPSVGIGFKNDTTNMLGLSFRPTGLALPDHSSWWQSPALDPLLYAAGSTPLLRERLAQVTWMTVPPGVVGPEFPYVLPEMNVYVRLS